MKYNIVNSGIVLFFPDAYSRDYVKLAWMEPPVERSGDDLHIADYHKVSLKNSTETHCGGDFTRKFFFLVSRMFFFFFHALDMFSDTFISIKKHCFSM